MNKHMCVYRCMYIQQRRPERERESERESKRERERERAREQERERESERERERVRARASKCLRVRPAETERKREREREKRGGGPFALKPASPKHLLFLAHRLALTGILEPRPSRLSCIKGLHPGGFLILTRPWLG